MILAILSNVRAAYLLIPCMPWPPGPRSFRYLLSKDGGKLGEVNRMITGSIRFLHHRRELILGHLLLESHHHLRSSSA